MPTAQAKIQNTKIIHPQMPANRPNVFRKERAKKIDEKLGIDLLNAGETIPTVATKLGCCTRTVDRLKSKYEIKVNPSISSKAINILKTVDLSLRMEKYRIRYGIIKRISDTISKTEKTIRAITFPGTEWIFEKDMLAAFPGKIEKIVGLEHDEENLDYSEEIMPAYNASINSIISLYHTKDTVFFDKINPPHRTTSCG